MADLRGFQDRSQTQANLRQIPVAPPQQTSAFQALGGAFQQMAPTIGSAMQAQRKQEAVDLQQKNLGSFTTKLAKAQQASQTDPNFDLAKAQRKIFQETIAANPSLTEDYIKTFKSVTGLEPAGMTAEQKAQQDLQDEAWKNGFGDPSATPEENAKQLDIYQDIQREAVLMEHDHKKYAHDQETAKREVIKRTGKLASLKAQSLNATLQSDLEKLANGGDRAAIMAKWAGLKTEWSQTVSQFGEFTDDPTVKAQLSGIPEIFALSDSLFKGEFEIAAAKRDANVLIAKEEAKILVDNPEAVSLVAASNMFKNQTALMLPINNLINKLMTQGPSDIRTVPTSEKDEGKKTLNNMGKSEDPDTRAEAQRHTVDVAKHLDRNGADYTDEQILETCNFMANPDVFNGMSNQDKETVKQACDTYAVDVAGKAIRDIEANSTISVPNEIITPRGDTRFGEPTLLSANNFSTLEVDANGFRYVATDAYRNNRQAQRVIQDMNRQMAKVNPVLSIYSSATGKTVEEVAGNVFGLGPQAASKELPEQPVSLQDRLTKWYEENLSQPTQVATEEQREAQARQIGQSFLDFFMASPEEHLRSITGQTGEEGEGTVLVPQQDATPTEAPVTGVEGAETVLDYFGQVEGTESHQDPASDDPDLYTYGYGLTEKTRRELGIPKGDNREMAQQALDIFEGKLKKSVGNYDNLSVPEKAGALAMIWNTGSLYGSAKKIIEAEVQPSDSELANWFTNTRASGQQLRGLGIRRASDYNKLAEARGWATVESATFTKGGKAVYNMSDGTTIVDERASRKSWQGEDRWGADEETLPVQ